MRETESEKTELILNMEHSTLYRAVVYRNWEYVRSLLQDHPNKLEFTEFTNSRRGETALHNACWWGGPLDIVESYFKVNPSVLMRLDNRLRSPLHYACGYASKEVVEFIIGAAPMATRLLDTDGLLPLHVAIKNRRAPSIIRKLLAAYPEAIHHTAHCIKRDITDADKKTPLELLYIKWIDDLSANIKGDISYLEYLVEGMDCDGLTTLKGSLQILLDAYFQTTTDEGSNGMGEENKKYPLHLALHLPDHILPSTFKHFMIKISPETKFREQDKGGNLPLHIAASKSCEQSNFIHLTLNRYSRAASVSNGVGKVPLTLAIESGKDWDKSGIEQIIQAAPEMISFVDPQTKLYPFMLAGACNRSVNDIFLLLRTFPELIKRNV